MQEPALQLTGGRVCRRFSRVYPVRLRSPSVLLTQRLSQPSPSEKAEGNNKARAGAVGPLGLCCPCPLQAKETLPGAALGAQILWRPRGPPPGPLSPQGHTDLQSTCLVHSPRFGSLPAPGPGGELFSDAKDAATCPGDFPKHSLICSTSCIGLGCYVFFSPCDSWQALGLEESLVNGK